MLIEWKGEGPLAVGDPRKSDYKLAAVIVCTPGVNRLPDDVWSRVKENSLMKQLIKDGKVVVTRDEPVTEEAAAKKGEAVDLFGLKLDVAIDVVKQTLNMELLETWAETETRPKLKRAIEKQIQSLIVKKPSKEE